MPVDQPSTPFAFFPLSPGPLPPLNQPASLPREYESSDDFGSLAGKTG